MVTSSHHGISGGAEGVLLLHHFTLSTRPRFNFQMFVVIPNDHG